MLQWQCYNVTMLQCIRTEGWTGFVLSLGPFLGISYFNFYFSLKSRTLSEREVAGTGDISGVQTWIIPGLMFLITNVWAMSGQNANIDCVGICKSWLIFHCIQQTRYGDKILTIIYFEMRGSDDQKINQMHISTNRWLPDNRGSSNMTRSSAFHNSANCSDFSVSGKY